MHTWDEYDQIFRTGNATPVAKERELRLNVLWSFKFFVRLHLISFNL